MAAPRQQQVTDILVMALACGATVAQAASKAGLSERTVYRRLAKPAFRERIDKLRADMVQRASAMLTASSMEAIKTLSELQAATQPGSVRLGAARAVLELGMRLREQTELHTRITTLEEIVKAAGHQTSASRAA